ncbi:hypothetical protein L1049_022880 [Liquidambar formosana]|uniref:Uncharacterized protein n=1 Tax=Liquidambar formosana TaxID=63359 RepID=A0AAP0RDA1_LIQFO
MEEFLNGRFRMSIADSIVMGILHSAMDRAHEKVQSKEGVLEQLNEILRFSELGIIQLEGCLKIVQAERDNYILENGYEKLLSDLTETRDRLCRRLKGTELAIADKDRELMERLENEWKLKQALELRERELISLCTDLELERTKSDGGTWEIISSNGGSEDEGRDRDECELDEENELYMNKNGCELMPPCHSFRPEQNEQMGSNIRSLKESWSRAFGMIKEAVSLSKLETMEQQWKWTVEKDTISILLKSFMRDLQENLEDKIENPKKQVSISSLMEQWKDMTSEMTTLRHELELLSSQNEFQAKSREGGHNALVPSAQSSCDSLSVQIEELDNVELPEEDCSDDSSHYVAKMIKNHESIIRQKSEELKWLNGEIHRDKGHSSLRKSEDPDGLPISIQRVTSRLDSFINESTKLLAVLDDCGGVHEKMAIDTSADVSSKL